MEPIYSRRYSREDDIIRVEPIGAESREHSERLPDMPCGSTWRDMLYGKAVEVTHLNRYGVDIYEGAGTMLIKIYLYCPRNITELLELLCMADVFLIDKEIEGFDVVVSMYYDLSAK